MKKLVLVIPIILLFFHLMYASDGPNMWTQSLVTPSAVWQEGIVINSTNTSIMYAGTAGAGVYKTTNAGANWIQVNNGLSNLIVQCMTISKSNPNIIMCGTTNTGTSPGIYRTTDGGANWTLKNNGITEPILPQAIAIDPTDPNICYTVIFIGTANAITGVYKSTDGGNNWAAAINGITTAKNFLSIQINPLNHNTVYIGSSFDFSTSTGPQKIYKSYNAGALWVDVSTGLPNLSTDINPVRSMSISNVDTSVVLAGLFQNTTTNGGMFLTTNGGGQWTKIQTGLPNVVGALIRSVLIRPGTTQEFFAGYDGVAPSTGIWRTTNQGGTWSSFASGVMQANYIVRALAFKTSVDSTLYAGVAGTVGMGVYEYSFIPVGISGQNGKIPKEFALYPNYPNPFNPATNIQYDVPKVSNVTMKIYDIRGREVATLVNENKQPGTYSVTFNASNYSSGVYFYRISAGDFTKTMKMILVK